MDLSFRPKILLRTLHETAKDYAIAAALGAIFLYALPSWLRCLSVFIGALCFLANVIAPFITDWKPRKQVNITAKAVFISGCDSGFGYGLAQKLDDLGFSVFAGCLFPKGEGAQSLQKSASDRLHIVELDVCNDDSVEKATQYVKENLGNNELWAVVCNAGINDGSDLLWTDMETIKRVVEINTFGVVRVTKAFLPQIIKSKGRVVAVSSAAGRNTYPGMVPYCMSKQAVVGFCDGLRLEMYRFGVKVITVEPWMFKTAITDEDTVRNYNTRSWEKAPADIKNLYPDNYIDMHIENVKKILYYSISHNPSEVVSCLEEAVVARNPKYSYNPGTLFSRTSFWVTKRLPKPLSDMLVLDVFNSKLKKL